MSPTDVLYEKYGKTAIDALWAIGLLSSTAKKSTAESVLRVIAKITEAVQKMMNGKLTEEEVAKTVSGFIDHLAQNDSKIDSEAKDRFGSR